MKIITQEHFRKFKNTFLQKIVEVTYKLTTIYLIYL